MEAIDQADPSAGDVDPAERDNVKVPTGTHNLYDVGESWYKLTIPAGVNFFGAPTVRGTRIWNGRSYIDQVLSWGTKLVMPFDVPSGATWFEILGNQDPKRQTRFSDIMLDGYRTIDPASITMHVPLEIIDAIDFRADHSCFKHTASGMLIYSTVNGGSICGVIDHCHLVNEYGTAQPYGEHTCGLGIYVNRGRYVETNWDPDMQNILGKYTPYTTFIEDCYFTFWRHTTVGQHGAHYVVRHSVWEDMSMYGDVDTHPNYTEPYAAARAFESYDNQWFNARGSGARREHQIRAGSGVIFDNVGDPTSNYFVYFYGGGWNPIFNPYVYMWNNTYFGNQTGGGQEGVNYENGKPDWYTKYRYPHPLAEGEPITRAPYSVISYPSGASGTLRRIA